MRSRFFITVTLCLISSADSFAGDGLLSTPQTRQMFSKYTDQCPDKGGQPLPGMSGLIGQLKAIGIVIDEVECGYDNPKNREIRFILRHVVPEISKTVYYVQFERFEDHKQYVVSIRRHDYIWKYSIGFFLTKRTQLFGEESPEDREQLDPRPLLLRKI